MLFSYFLFLLINAMLCIIQSTCTQSTLILKYKRLCRDGRLMEVAGVVTAEAEAATKVVGRHIMVTVHLAMGVLKCSEASHKKTL